MTDARQRARGGSGSGTAPGIALDNGLLPVIQKESDHPCFQCARCCTYVAIEIDRPTTMKEYDYIVWYLYHEGLSVFVDWEGDWFVKFESRCRHLTAQGLCGVYEARPAICRDFDWRECENTVRDEPADKWLFETADDFLAWLEERRPKSFQRFRRYMRRRQQDDAEPELGRVRITDLGAPRARRRAR